MIKWPWVSRRKYERYRDACYNHRYSGDPAWKESEYQLRRLAQWYYEYEGINPRSDKETVELVTMRFLELRKLASSRLTRPVFLTEAEEQQALLMPMIYHKSK
jgi:hypothetical protein